MREEKSFLSIGNISWALIFFVGLILVATNPDESRFKEFLNKDLKQQGYEEGGITGGLMSIFSRPTSWFLSLSTKRKNYVFISVYNVSVFGDEYVYVGGLNHFVRLK